MMPADEYCEAMVDVGDPPLNAHLVRPSFKPAACEQLYTSITSPLGACHGMPGLTSRHHPVARLTISPPRDSCHMPCALTSDESHGIMATLEPGLLGYLSAPYRHQFKPPQEATSQDPTLVLKCFGSATVHSARLSGKAVMSAHSHTSLRTRLISNLWVHFEAVLRMLIDQCVAVNLPLRASIAYGNGLAAVPGVRITAPRAPLGPHVVLEAAVRVLID